MNSRRTLHYAAANTNVPCSQEYDMPDENRRRMVHQNQ